MKENKEEEIAEEKQRKERRQRELCIWTKQSDDIIRRCNIVDDEKKQKKKKKGRKKTKGNVDKPNENNTKNIQQEGITKHPSNVTQEQLTKNRSKVTKKNENSERKEEILSTIEQQKNNLTLFRMNAFNGSLISQDINLQRIRKSLTLKKSIYDQRKRFHLNKRLDHGNCQSSQDCHLDRELHFVPLKTKTEFKSNIISIKKTLALKKKEYLIRKCELCSTICKHIPYEKDVDAVSWMSLDLPATNGYFSQY